jgi:hypothetical protein
MLKASLLGAGLMVLAACAGNPTAPPRHASAASSSGSPVGCVNKTATRLPTSPEDCAGFGNSHSDTAIQSTGQNQAQDALKMLNPSVSVGH